MQQLIITYTLLSASFSSKVINLMKSLFLTIMVTLPAIVSHLTEALPSYDYSNPPIVANDVGFNHPPIDSNTGMWSTVSSCSSSTTSCGKYASKTPAFIYRDLDLASNLITPRSVQCPSSIPVLAVGYKPLGANPVVLAAETAPAWEYRPVDYGLRELDRKQQLAAVKLDDGQKFTYHAADIKDFKSAAAAAATAGTCSAPTSSSSSSSFATSTPSPAAAVVSSSSSSSSSMSTPTPAPANVGTCAKPSPAPANVVSSASSSSSPSKTPEPATNMPYCNEVKYPVYYGNKPSSSVSSSSISPTPTLAASSASTTPSKTPEAATTDDMPFCDQIKYPVYY